MARLPWTDPTTTFTGRNCASACVTIDGTFHGVPSAHCPLPTAHRIVVGRVACQTAINQKAAVTRNDT